MWISPHYQDSDFQSVLVSDASSDSSANFYRYDYELLPIENKIAIFLDRTEGWQLGIAEQVSGIDGSGFAILQIILSYFEAFAKYYEGNTEDSTAGESFKNGVMLVFPTLDKILDGDLEAVLHGLWSGARCGLYHTSIAAGHIEVGSLPDEWFQYDRINMRITIDPPRLVKKLQEHLAVYSVQLRDSDNIQLRANFVKRFNYDASRTLGAK